MRRFLERGGLLYATLFVWPWIGSSLGYWIGIRILLPLLDLLPAYSAMLFLLHRGLRRRAVVGMLIWALGLGTAGTTLAGLYPERGEQVTFQGTEYRQEMFQWIRTGQGAESNPKQFIPQHLAHVTVFFLLSLGTASLLSMTFGAILMNYMSFYVGSLFLQGENPLAILWMGWPPWSVIRVGSYVTMGVILAEPMLSRLWRYSLRLGELKVYLVIAGAGLGLDLILKFLLAPPWRTWLFSAIGPVLGTP